MKPVTILMSDHASGRFEQEVGSVLADIPFRIVHLDTEPGSDDCTAIDIAFLTRDVTGNSGKTVLFPDLTRFYEIVRAAPNLSWLQTHSSGTDRPIFAELNKRGIRITTASGTTAVPVAQMAITGMLSLARRLPVLMDAQRRKSWEPLHPPRSPRDLQTLKAAVIGLGPIGREIVRLCDAFGMTTYGVSRTARDNEPLVEKAISYEEMESILPESDFVFLACPLTDSTRHILNESRMRVMPKGAHVINVARGEVVDEAAMIRLLEEEHLGGAFLDVFQKEPLDSTSPLWEMPNVIISPHTAAHTTGHFDAVGRLFLENLRRWCSKEKLINMASF